MSTADQRTQPVTQRLASSYSLVFAPALVLALLVVLAGIEAGLGLWGTAALLLGTAVIPGLVYKKTGPLFRHYNLSDRWWTAFVLVLTFTGTVFCFVLDLAEPVPATAAALFFGNAGLVLVRYWLNASAHVSVMTFAVLWVIAVYGIVLTPLLILPPVMVVSRVVLRQHSVQEALWGAFLGSTTFCCFLLVTTWS